MIAVSIVSYNTKELLKDCLENITSQKISQKFEIWVLDNDSSDGSADMVKREFPKVNLIKTNQNLGFAKGHNRILKKLKSEYVLILNPDTQIPSDAIEKMYTFMENNPACGIASCKIVGFDDKLHSNGGDLPFGTALFNWLFNLETLGFKKNFHRQDKGYFEKPHEVGWVGGTFMFVRSIVFEKVGYLNEDYFMYFEDTEFCFLTRKKGFKVMINPQVVIKHASGASSQDPRFRQWLGEFKGLIGFYKRQFGDLTGLLVKILVYLSVVLRLVVFTLVGKLDFSKTYAKVLGSI